MVENSTVDGIRKARPSADPCRLAGHSGASGTVTGPDLGSGNAGFDSPVPDVWACSAVGSAPPIMDFDADVGQKHVDRRSKHVLLPKVAACAPTVPVIDASPKSLGLLGGRLDHGRRSTPRYGDG
jgi:hypothetical protein